MEANEQPEPCSLCGLTSHVEPAPAPYNLTCPGENAELADQERFLSRLAVVKTVAAQYGPDVAADAELVDKIWHRQIAAEARFAKDEEGNPLFKRSAITAESLREHASAFTKSVVARVATDALIEEVAFEPEGHHLTVERRIEQVRTSSADSTPLSHKAGKRYGDDSDYSFFLGSED
jgi:hypothetical protein